MKNVYKGPPEGIKEAFYNLSADELQKYKKIVDQTQREFVVKLQKYINSLEKDGQLKYREKIKRSFKEQDALIDWSAEQEESSDGSDEEDSE
jgi:hypothetical protein